VTGKVQVIRSEIHDASKEQCSLLIASQVQVEGKRAKTERWQTISWSTDGRKWLLVASG